MRFASRLAARLNETELVILTVGLPGRTAPIPVPRSKTTNGVAAKYRFVPARSAGLVPETISQEADRLKADLVVIGSEGRDTLSEWVVGGVALRLIYVARRPVVVVRPPRRRGTAAKPA